MSCHVFLFYRLDDQYLLFGVLGHGCTITEPPLPTVMRTYQRPPPLLILQQTTNTTSITNYHHLQQPHQSPIPLLTAWLHLTSCMKYLPLDQSSFAISYHHHYDHYHALILLKLLILLLRLTTYFYEQTIFQWIVICDLQFAIPFLFSFFTSHLASLKMHTFLVTNIHHSVPQG